MSYSNSPFQQPSAGSGPRACPNCHRALGPYSSVCSFCGSNGASQMQGERSRLAAGLFGLLMPCGIHSFYLGDTKKGVLQLVLTLVTCGIAGLWSFIEGIMILAGSINYDADGRPLAK